MNFGVWVEVLVRVEADSFDEAETLAIAVATGRNPGAGDVEEANVTMASQR